MYERSAIVLERYFNSVFGYSSEYNLKNNFDNYCELVTKLEEFQLAYTKEQIAIQEFNDVTEGIRNLQKKQEKLYQKNANLEYSRNMLFSNVEESPEEIEKCILKIEDDIDKNNKLQIEIREKFVENIRNFNEKRNQLDTSKQNRNDAEEEYNEIFVRAQENVQNINEFNLEFARNFTGTQIKEKLVALMIDNGKSEKVPFDTEVISNVADVSLDIAQREIECYVDMYENINRLFDEISKNAIKLDKFKKRMRNTKVKLNFLFAEKEYIVQFLDYERITAVNGKRAHKKLMEEACENFKLDVAQIDNLYELILREIATKSTKKGYKELYNKSYLLDIKEKEANFKKEKNKVNLNAGTILNSNYWRIEGIKNIYTVFYNDVSEQFGKDLDEFDIPKDEDESNSEGIDIFENIPSNAESFEEEIPQEENIILDVEEEEEEPDTSPIAKVEQAKVNMFENLIFEEDDENIEDEESEDDIDTEESFDEKIEHVSKPEEKEEFDIFAGKYNSIASALDDIDELEDYQNSEINEKDNIFDDEEDEDSDDNDDDDNDGNGFSQNDDEDMIITDEDDIPYEDEDDFLEYSEESLFGNIKAVKNKKKNKSSEELLQDLQKEDIKKTSKKGIFQSLIRMNASKGKKKATN